LRVRLDSASRRNAEGLVRALREGSPSIWAYHDAESVAFNLTTVAEGDETIIAGRLRELLGG
jgi:hypothetical protein